MRPLHASREWTKLPQRVGGAACERVGLSTPIVRMAVEINAVICAGVVSSEPRAATKSKCPLCVTVQREE